MPPSLKGKIAAARRRWRAFETVGGVLAALSALAALLLVGFYTDRLLILSRFGRQGWQWALLAGFGVAFLVFVLVPLLRPLSDATVATHVERRFPDLNERLLTTVELAHAGAGTGVSAPMIGQLARETERLVERLNFAVAVPLAPLGRPSAFASVAAILLIGHAALAPEAMRTWLRRVLDPVADIPVYARTLVWALPGDQVLPRGADVTIGVKAGGRLPDRATLHYQFVGTDKWIQVELSKPATVRTASGETFHRFAFAFPDAQQSIRYYATANDGRSNPHTLRVEDRPAILGVRLNLTFPAYTGRRPQIVTATAGNVVAPVGTRVEVTATANKPLRSARFVQDGKPLGNWQIRGRAARGRLSVLRDGTYGLRLRDTSGFDAAQTPQYTIRAQPDQPPAVQVVAPAMDLERTPTGTVALLITARDDWGVRDTGLAYRFGARSGTLALPGANNRLVVNTGGEWNLGALPLKPGDVVTFEAVARDAVPQTGRSAAYRVRILSVGEMRDRIESRAGEEMDTLRRLVERHRQAQAELARASRITGPNRAAALAQAQATERSLAGETADLARRMAQTTQQMRDNNIGATTEQTRRDAASKSLRRLGAQAMPRAADAIARNALADAGGQEQAIQREMERIAREIGRAPDAAALAQEANRLAREQQRLAEQTDLARAAMGEKTAAQMSKGERAELNALARQQAELRARTEALQDQVARSARDADERRQANAAAMLAASRQAQAAGPTQNQARAQRSLQSGSPSEASPQQSEAARDLQNLADQLRQAADQTPDAEAQRQRAAGMNEMASELEKMAREQNAIRQENRKAAALAAEGEEKERDAATARKLAEREQALGAQAGQAAPRLGDVPEAQKAAAQAAESLQAAADKLNQSALGEALDPALEAQRQLEQAARKVRETAETMEQTAALNRMQQVAEMLARDQRAAQKQTREMDQARQRGAPAAEQKKRLDALRKTQSDLAKRGRALRDEMPSDPYRWAANQAVQRMERAEDGLGKSDPGPATQRRQEQAAQTLERIARTLGQQAQAQNQAQQMQSGSPQQAESANQMAQAGSQLQLAREMQAQIHQETAGLEGERRRSPTRSLTPEQQRDLDRLRSAQRETENIAREAARQLRALPDANRNVEQAQDEMESAGGMLQQQETGAPTQGHQQAAVRLLDQAVDQVQQAMQQMQQQMMAAAQQSGQQQQQQQANQDGPTGDPRRRNPISPLRNSGQSTVGLRGRGFGGLDPRGQRSLQEGRNERVPAEYRDLVNQYYKALSQKER